MLKLRNLAILGLFPLISHAAQPWQEVTMPTVAEAAAAFPKPPMEYRAVNWAIWGGQLTRDKILADIEHVYANGGGVYMINNSGGHTPKYFTPEYMDLVKLVVSECKQRGMKVWIETDDGYPDGFAGGMISRDYPQLGMQAIVNDARYTVAGGQTLTMPLPPDTLGILANPRAAAPAGTVPGAMGPVVMPALVPVAAPAAGGARGAGGGGGARRGGAAASAPASQSIPVPTDGKFKWTAPTGGMSNGLWEVTFQGSAGEARYTVACGQTLTIPLPTDTKGIQASPLARGPGRGPAAGGAAAAASTVIAVPADGQFKWTAPGTGTWEVTFVRHVYRSSPTRNANRADGTRDKDSLYSLIDYLDPAATATFIKLIHEQYAKLVGDEFGKTIMGFRGDEPDYTGIIPWTPKLLETFQQQKGYDLKPYLAQFFATSPTQDGLRAKADYWDVWSALFRDNFFKPQEDWCRARNMSYMMHLNHEEIMMGRNGGEDLIKNEGSFWRTMRYVGVPGIDNLSQIRPGTVADFPKLAGSAAHLYGRSLVWTEQGGGGGAAGKFVFDYQLVRGINHMNIGGLTAATPSTDAAPSPAAQTAWYVGRSQYLMAVGRPAAQVALFHPTDSYWMGDQEADTVDTKLTTQLMEQQIDFDHIDSDTLATVCTLEGGGLKNLSGQVYRAVVVPTSTVITQGVLERLRAFAAAGGKVVFVGRTPTMVVDKTFLHPAAGAPDLSFATLEPTPDITPKVVAALPKPDVKLDAACAPIKYLHRSLKDGEVYFFFNESAQNQSRNATLAGTGQAQVWDAASGKIQPVAGAVSGPGSVTVPLSLASQEARFIVIGPMGN